MPDPGISVVIPTFNRARLLDRTLTSLAAQEGLSAPVEVIVVDDGSTDDTPDVVAQYPGAVSLRQDNAGPAAARNRGWSVATGRVVVFTDDDTVPDRRWLADVAEAFTADPGLHAAGGTVRPLRLSFLTRFVQAEQHASHGVGADGAIKYLVTANCAYRRDVLTALGGFDESFPAASGEDADLTARARAAGYRLRLLDAAVVLHDHPDRVRTIVRTYLKHGRSRRLVVDKNPSTNWDGGRREVLTAEHWRRRFHAYRTEGLGPAASLVALVLRVAGLLAYAVGMAQSRRGHRVPATPASIRVAIACPGADHVARGYERVARELADLLRTDPQLSVSLVKGSGGSSRDVVLPSLRRDRPVARWISRWSSGPGATETEARRIPGDRRLAGRGRLGLRHVPFWSSARRRFCRVPATRTRGASWGGLLVRLARRRVAVTPYDIEAASFGVSLLFHAVVRRPDVLVLQDVAVARVVGVGRVLPGWRTRILFINDAPWPPPYPFADVVQHVTPVTCDEDPAERWDKVLLPLGTNVPDGVTQDRAASRRHRFGLPEHAKVVVSIGTMLDHHKRHLHLIDELATLSEPRPFLVIAGSPNVDQHRIEAAARQSLGDRYAVIHVGPDDVAELLACADAFVLASLREGFGLVYLEALAAGLPTIVHRDRLQQWILGPFGTYVDMTERGGLASCLEEVLARDDRWSLSEARRRYVRDRFSWTSLRGDYVALVRRTSGGSP